MALSKWLLAAAGLAMAVAADDPHIYSMTTVPDYEVESEMTLQVSAPGSNILALAFSVAPLTGSAGLNQSDTARDSIDIYGNLISVTESNYNNISGTNEIAYLCCDDTNDSFIDPDDMLATLMAHVPKAILLYSQVGNCCAIDTADMSNLTYGSIFTMVSTDDAAQTLNVTNSDVDNGIRTTITSTSASNDPETSGTENGNNSAIAMSVLYSITGLITVLFLAIIAMGAARAHRYPERYGPRSGYGGQPRQSRAKGIARAVLETLPIVKFGDNNPPKPDPTIELESRGGGNPGETPRNLAPGDVQAHYLSTIPEDAEAHSKSAAGAGSDLSDPKVSGGLADVAPTTGSGSAAPDDNDNPVCSICTEDFTVGEDVRVLPCNHKFHPNCVDPWLVNVSGTCPLCRLDLRPAESEQNPQSPQSPQSPQGPQNSSEENLPPPLDSDETVYPAAASYPHRRASRLFDLNRLRHASVEERIEVLRRYRSEAQTEHHASSMEGAAGEDELSSSARLTRRLRDRFRILTHAQSPDMPSGQHSRIP